MGNDKIYTTDMQNSESNDTDNTNDIPTAAKIEN